MAKTEKKAVREAFRQAVFTRDGFKCVMCGDKAVDSHHICDRSLIIHQGSVKENGISLCAKCHKLAEQYHATGIAYPGYSPDDLYAKIGSDYEKAWQASEQLNPTKKCYKHPDIVLGQYTSCPRCQSEGG